MTVHDMSGMDWYDKESNSISHTERKGHAKDELLLKSVPIDPAS